MSSWTLPRPFRQPRPQVRQLPSEQPAHDDHLGPPPRYSNLAPIPDPRYDPRGSPVTPPSSASHADFISSRFSAVSLESPIASPPYTTHAFDVDATLASASRVTVTSPPHYSSLLEATHVENVQGSTENAGPGGGEASPSEHTFDIRSGFKSERWATLTLLSPGSPAGNQKKGRHPRYSSIDSVLGNVKLCLPNPQTIKNVELTLRGSVITGAGNDGSTTFLEQGYTLWDRRFGDPQLLAHGRSQVGPKYDGRMSGTWAFPFSIPFPTLVDLSTRRAVYPSQEAGPVRFLPEHLDGEGIITPFNLEGGSIDMGPTLSPPADRSPITMTVPGIPTGKGRLALHRADMSTPSASLQSSPMATPTSTAPSIPLLEPYILCHPDTNNDASDGAVQPECSSPLHQTFAMHGQQQSVGGASGLHDSSSVATVSTDCHPLPQSFLEREVMVSVRYEISLRISHGRFSTKSRVSTPVVYTPVTVSRPMTLAREVSYRHRGIPPGPDLDPAGWKQLNPATIRGTFSDQKTLTVRYELFLAMPLSYARGTVLPCCLTVSCDDTVALNLFANPRTPHVRLRRSTHFLHDHTEYTRMGDTPSWESQSPIRPNLGALAWRQRRTQPGEVTRITPFLLAEPDEEEAEEEDILSPLGERDGQDVGDKAVWCTPAHFTQEPRMRKLYGEIRLPQALQPTCKFPLFNILYRVGLLAPATNAFVPDQCQPSSPKGKGKAAVLEEGDEAERVYSSHIVEITTVGRDDEPTPIAFVGLVD